jgi:hypothetical protein
MKKDIASITSFDLFKEAEAGFLNGSVDLKNTGFRDFRIKVVLQNDLRTKPLIIWSTKFSPSEKNWNLTRLGVLLSLESALRLSNGSLHRERFVRFLLSLLFPEFFLVMEKRDEGKRNEIATTSLILIFKLRRWEISTRQTLLAQDISEGQRVLPDSIPFIRWILQVTQLSQASSLINRASLCANILLKHGDLWEFPAYLRWTMRWLLQVEDAIPLASLKSSVFICFWESIWYSSLKENQEEMPRLKVLMNSGKRGCLEDILVLPLFPLEEPVNDSRGITIIRNPTGPLLKKSTAHDSLVYSEIKTGDISDTAQKDLPLMHTLTLLVIFIFLLQREKFPLTERLMLMVKLRSMGPRISSEGNLRGNMWLPVSLLIEKDWLSNKGGRSSNLFLFLLRVILLLLYLQLQKEKHDLVHDVMRIQSIRNQFTML